jgi:hypothetical protein
VVSKFVPASETFCVHWIVKIACSTHFFLQFFVKMLIFAGFVEIFRRTSEFCADHAKIAEKL